MPLNERSLRNLEGVHPDLSKVVKAAAETCPVIVTEGLRTLERQKELVAAGKSKTLRSRHLTGHAVDLVYVDAPGSVSYDMEHATLVANAMRAAAKDANVPIEWGAAKKYGGNFNTFNDAPHFQLPWKQYPAEALSNTRRVVETVKTKTGVAIGAGGAGLTLPNVPAPPDLAAYTAWRGFGDTATGLLSWCWANPIIPAALAVWVLVLVYLPKLRAPWVQSSD